MILNVLYFYFMMNVIIIIKLVVILLAYNLDENIHVALYYILKIIIFYVFHFSYLVITTIDLILKDFIHQYNLLLMV